MEQFLSTYRILNADNLHLLGDIYTMDVQFIDPAHEILGLAPLKEYFAALYKNVESIRFDFHELTATDNTGYVQWDMTFSHRKLSGGKAISLPGATFVRFHPGGKVFHHRDYFDLGAMVYEHLPLLGGLLKQIKRRLGQ